MVWNDRNSIIDIITRSLQIEQQWITHVGEKEKTTQTDNEVKIGENITRNGYCLLEVKRKMSNDENIEHQLAKRDIKIKEPEQKDKIV